MEDDEKGSRHGTDKGEAHEEVRDTLLDHGRRADERETNCILLVALCADDFYVRLVDG